MDSSAVTIPAASGKCSRSWENLSASVEWPNAREWPPWRCFCVRNEAVFLTGVDYPIDGGFMTVAVRRECFLAKYRRERDSHSCDNVREVKNHGSAAQEQSNPHHGRGKRNWCGYRAR